MKNKTGCLGWFVGSFRPAPEAVEFEWEKKERETLPYGLRDRFLSLAELDFYRVLVTIVPDGAQLLVKVRIGDILFTRQPHKNFGAQKKILMKHVDFLLVESLEMRPLVAIELDDSSHEKPDRRTRDEFVDQAFAAAGLPIVHIKCAREYDRANLAEIVSSVL